MPDDALFQTVDLPTFQGNLVQLLCRTARDKGRVEITCDEGTCVMISKEELSALEAALEILSSTDEVRKLHHTVRRFVRFDDGGADEAHLPAALALHDK